MVQGDSVPSSDLLVPIVDVADTNVYGVHAVRIPEASAPSVCTPTTHEGSASAHAGVSAAFPPEASSVGSTGENPGSSGRIVQSDDPKKKSRFGLPSFMSPSSRKDRKEERTGEKLKNIHDIVVMLGICVWIETIAGLTVESMPTRNVSIR